MTRSDPQLVFARLIRALYGALDDVVFVGGWAHRLHAIHPLASRRNEPPLTTDDADVLLANPLKPILTEPSLASRLIREGFTERYLGRVTPPAIRYQLSEDDGGFYVEFLAAQRGSEYDRRGERRVTIQLSGLSVQRLAHLDILAAKPWVVRLDARDGFPAEVDGIEIRIANASTYVAQKLLVLADRPLEKRKKDILYLYDTLDMFSAVLDDLRALWLSVESSLSRRARKELDTRRRALVSSMNEAIRGSHDVARRSGRTAPPEPDVILSTLRYGLHEIFGD